MRSYDAYLQQFSKKFPHEAKNLECISHHHKSTSFFLKGAEYSAVQMYYYLTKRFLEIDTYVAFENSS